MGKRAKEGESVKRRENVCKGEIVKEKRVRVRAREVSGTTEM